MMRYTTLLVFLPVSFLAVSLEAQPSREQYRAPYQAWRQAAPALEQDAAEPSQNFSASVQLSADGARQYLEARSSYLSAPPQSAEQTAWVSKPLPAAEALLTPAATMDQWIATRLAKITSDMAGFKADDKDPAIRRVRQAMERERAALRAVTESVAARKAPLTELVEQSEDAEILRTSVFQTLNAAGFRRTQAAEHVKREAADWSTYYKDLSEAALGAARVAATVAGVTPGGPPAPAKVVRPPTNQIPLTRYVGDWTFPARGLYYGPQPEAVEMSVRESAGNVTGTLAARFNAPARTVRFDFQGVLQPQAKSQSFALQTPEGSAGTVELIPGSAFNLLEVNFQASGAVGNFILLKK